MKKTSKKVTLKTLDTKIDGITETVGTLTSTVNTLTGTVDALTGTVNTLTDNVATLTNTVDGLAISTKKGFDEVKGEIKEFKEEMTDFKKNTELTLFNLDSHARTTNERLGAIEKALPPVANLSEALKREVLQLNVRVGKIEAKVGIKTT